MCTTLLPRYYLQLNISPRMHRLFQWQSLSSYLKFKLHAWLLKIPPKNLITLKRSVQKSNTWHTLLLRVLICRIHYTTKPINLYCFVNLSAFHSTVDINNIRMKIGPSIAFKHCRIYLSQTLYVCTYRRVK